MIWWYVFVLFIYYALIIVICGIEQPFYWLIAALIQQWATIFRTFTSGHGVHVHVPKSDTQWWRKSPILRQNVCLLRVCYDWQETRRWWWGGGVDREHQSPHVIFSFNRYIWSAGQAAASKNLSIYTKGHFPLWEAKRQVQLQAALRTVYKHPCAQKCRQGSTALAVSISPSRPLLHGIRILFFLESIFAWK